MANRFGLHLLLIACAAPCAAARASAQELPEDVTTHGFSIHDTRAAGALLDSAEAHVAAGRWSGAARDLQRLIEDHPTDVVAIERPLYRGRPSQQPVYRGASVRAREILMSLPPAGVETYRMRFEETAQLALDAARARTDRRALAEVGRRWPLCRAAQLAWWSLGDVELELGDVDATLSAWRRALGLHIRSASPDAGSDLLADPARWARALQEHEACDDPHAGLLLRFAVALELLHAESGEARLPRLLSELRLPGPGEGLGPPPGRDADKWARPFRVPHHPVATHGALQPVRAADHVLVSNSMRLFAIDAYTGTQRWDSGEAPGWDDLDLNQRKEFFEGLDREAVLIAPAATERIAVAALQIPVTHIPNEDYQRIRIMSILPDRRLFAFDLASGRELWNHMPPAGWNGDSGSFPDRMRVAGPPVIAGSRVLVPTVRMQGRIDYHVGCYELETGELLWSAGLISGQRETNMFGRALHEFSAPPLRVDGDHVVALTQLGTIAALDLYTGEILWETLYDQVPLPKNRQYDPTPRRRTWRNAPPVVADGLAIATPVDGEDLIAVDLASGALVWSLRRERLRALVRRDADLDLLLGADERTVYLAGNRVVALEASSGLARGLPTRARWVFDDEALEESSRFRPVLARDRVVVPLRNQRIEIDRLSGKRLSSIPWERDGGNVLVDDGALFRLSGRWLSGHFEWDTLLSRARLAVERRPDDPVASLALAELLANRGLSEWTAHGRADEAQIHLIEARELLDAFIVEGRTGEHEAALSAELHRVLRGEARVRSDLADTGGALRALRRARELAPTREDLRDAFLEELGLLAGRLDGAFERTLETLEEACGDMPLPCEVRVAELEPRADVGLPPLPRFVPVIGSAPLGDSLQWTIPVGLWVAIERTRAAERVGDDPLVFEVLHGMLARWGRVELPGGTVADLAGDRIGALLAAHRTRGYATFEARAHERLDEALRTRDRERLLEVAQLFPHSRAARQANDALLGWAREDGDAETVARIALSELPERWRREEASERDASLLLELVSALDGVGNHELLVATVARLARVRPDLRCAVAGQPETTLAELAGTLAAPRSMGPTDSDLDLGAPPGFDADCETRATLTGEHELLGIATPAWPGVADASREDALLVVARSDRSDDGGRVLGLSSATPDRPVWEHSFPHSATPRRWRGRVAFAADRVVVALEPQVVALTASTGDAAWSWRPAVGRIEGVVADDGVALIVVRSSDDVSTLVALDAHAGTYLWEVDASDPGLQRRPLVGEGYVVLLPNQQHRRLIVRDLLSGRLAYAFELPSNVKYARQTFYESCWIENGKLILPWFLSARHPDRNHVLALDLRAGRLAWRCDIAGTDGLPRDLHWIVQHGGRTWLGLISTQSSNDAEPFGEIRELYTDIGELSNPVGGLRLRPSDVPVGVVRRQRVELATPQLFLRSPARGMRATLLRRVHLAYGERWAHALPVASEDLYNTLMPLPAMSASTVAFAYTEWRKRENRTTKPVTSLLFVDADSGLAHDTRQLAVRFGRQENIELFPLGRCLVVRGSKQLEILR